MRKGRVGRCKEEARSDEEEGIMRRKDRRGGRSNKGESLTGRNDKEGTMRKKEQQRESGDEEGAMKMDDRRGGRSNKEQQGRGERSLVYQ